MLLYTSLMAILGLILMFSGAYVLDHGKNYQRNTGRVSLVLGVILVFSAIAVIAYLHHATTN